MHWLVPMAAEVGSLLRILNARKEEKLRNEATVLITRDLLGSCSKAASADLDLDLQVPTGWEKRLDLKVYFPDYFSQICFSLLFLFRQFEFVLWWMELFVCLFVCSQGKCMCRGVNLQALNPGVKNQRFEIWMFRRWIYWRTVASNWSCSLPTTIRVSALSTRSNPLWREQRKRPRRSGRRLRCRFLRRWRPEKREMMKKRSGRGRCLRLPRHRRHRRGCLQRDVQCACCTWWHIGKTQSALAATPLFRLHLLLRNPELI